jgi:hypothetical protein
LNGRVVANDVLFVLVEQVVEYLLVEQCDAFEVIAAPWFEADYLINQPVALM